MSDDEGTEHTITIIKKAFAFKIPKRSSSKGYRAADWDKEPVWKGQLRVVEKNGKAAVLLEHVDKEGIFAACPINNDPNKPASVEATTDSSRYFVLRLEDGKGNHAYIGLGFNSRDDSFEFKVALRDFSKQEQELEEIKTAEESDNVPKMDYSLKGPIKLGKDFSSKKEDDSPVRKKKSSKTGSDSSGLLPPPAAGRSRKGRSPDTSSQKASKSTPTEQGSMDDLLGLGIEIKAEQNKKSAEDDFSIFDF